jgi:hypothetical protein
MQGISFTQLITSPTTWAANSAAGTTARAGRARPLLPAPCPPGRNPLLGAWWGPAAAWNEDAGRKASGSSSMAVQRPRRSTHTCCCCWWW